MINKELSVDEALKHLREIEDDDPEPETFEEFAEQFLSYGARCKEDWMNPKLAGKGAMNNGECDIMWVCQGDCDVDDFDQLLNAFGQFYKKETDGKTYSVVMKSRSYPGDGDYMKRKVKYTNGSWEKVSDKDDTKVAASNSIELILKKLYNKKGFIFVIESRDEDIYSDGQTFGEVKAGFKKELEDLNDYLQLDDGYEIANTEVIVDWDKPDDYSVEDFMKDNNIDEVEDDDEGIYIADGEYITYESLTEY